MNGRKLAPFLGEHDYFGWSASNLLTGIIRPVWGSLVSCATVGNGRQCPAPQEGAGFQPVAGCSRAPQGPGIMSV